MGNVNSPMPIERKLAAIMFTDIAGYTALSAKDSTKTSELLKTQRHILKPIVEKHGGSWMKEMGDGVLLTFDSATSAVECSIAIQEATKDIEHLNLRIGIHEGEVIKQDGDVIGDDVNIASRIEPFSAVGGVAISDKIYRAISSNQAFETKYIGKPKLKGVSQEVKVYCITSRGLPETEVSKVSAKLEEEPKFNLFALTGAILTAIGIAFWIAVGVFDVSFGYRAEVPSVGILMMENLGKEEEEFWSSGMTNDLITKVAGAGLIRVAPLKEILNLDKELSIEEIAKKLRVKYILTHSFLIKDDDFDLWCKLENTDSGVALFSNKISKSMDMATLMVGKLANDIITSLKVQTKQDIMKAPTDNTKAYEYYLKSRYIYRKHKNLEDIEITRGFLQKAIEIDDNLLVAKDLMAQTYFTTNSYDKALQLYMDNLKQAEILSSNINIADALLGIAVVYWSRMELNKAENYLMRSLNIFQELGDSSRTAKSLQMLGNVGSEGKSDYEKRALNIWQELGDYFAVSGILNAMANTYVWQGNYESALDVYHQSLDSGIKSGIRRSLYLPLLNIGSMNYKMGKYDEAIKYYHRSLDIAKELENKQLIGYLLFNIGKSHFVKNNYKEALTNIEQSITLLEELNTFIEIEVLEIYTLLYTIYKTLGKEFDINKIYTLVEETKKSEEQTTYLNSIRNFELNLLLYKLLEDKSYLENSYNNIQKTALSLDDGYKAKFLSYPIPKAIVEDWEKVNR